MIRSFFAATALMLAIAPLPVRADDYVVIESSVPALAVGATLSSGTALDIGQKGRVVLMTSSGQVVTLSGPYEGPPPAAGAGAPQGDGDIPKIVATLLGQKDRRNEVGVVRAVSWRADAVSTIADALAIDATDGGDMCVFDPGQAEVIRDPKLAGPLKVQSMSSGAEATITWEKDKRLQHWPSALPLSDGDILSFSQSGSEEAALATIHVLPADPTASDVKRALAMAGAGCAEQARSLLSVIARSAR